MEIHIGNRVADVTLVSKEGNKVRLSIDGKPYDVDIVMTENGSCSVLHDGNSFNAEIISGEDHRSYDANISFGYLRYPHDRNGRTYSRHNSDDLLRR